MDPDIRWITPVYGFADGRNETHISFHENVRKKVREMLLELLGTTGLVADLRRRGDRSGLEPGWAAPGGSWGRCNTLDLPEGATADSLSLV